MVRFSPNTLPLFEEDGTRIDLVRWLKGRHAPAGRMVSRRVWLQADQQQVEVRVVALRLSEAQTQAARRRTCQKAQKDQRRIQPDTLYVAGWLLLVTTLPVAQWSAAEVLALYRSRWQIEWLFKRIKHLLDMHRLACVPAESVQARILALLLSWILQEEELVAARFQLQEATCVPIDTPTALLLPEPQQGQTGATPPAHPLVLPDTGLAELSCRCLLPAGEEALMSYSVGKVRAYGGKPRPGSFF